MYKHFDKLLEKALEKRAISLRQFAREVGVSAAVVSRVKHGHRPVPTEHIESWANALKLTGLERAEFVNAAYWTAVPKRVRPWVESQIAAAKRGS
jgi:transcriptional regulator with XRE-family HTH domain